MLHFVFLWHIVFCWIFFALTDCRYILYGPGGKNISCINDDVKDKVVKYGVRRSWMLALLLIKETFGVISNHLKFKIHHRELRYFHFTFKTTKIFTLRQMPASSISNYIKRGLIAQNLFCAITPYCTKLFCEITAYCTKPVLSNKPASKGGLIAKNPLPENIARWRRWVLEMH